LDDGHVRLRALKLAVRRGERAAAEELLEEYTADDETPPFLFQQAVEVLDEAGWGGTVNLVIDAAVDEEAAIPVVGRLWTERHADDPDADVNRKLDEMLRRGDIGDEALIVRLETLARAKRAAALFAFVDKYK